MELFASRRPHCIDGYTGHCPQYLNHFCQALGTTAHKLLINPCCDQRKQINQNNYDHYRKPKLTIQEINLIKRHENMCDPIIDGHEIKKFDSFIPYLTDLIGRHCSTPTGVGRRKCFKPKLAS